MKSCTHCKQLKELSNFGFDRHQQDGRNSRCRECLSSLRKSRNFTAIIDGEKKCMKCKEILNVSFFGKNKQNYDGLTVYCKKCTAVIRKEYWGKNPQKWEAQRDKNFIKWRAKLGIDPSIKLRNKKGEGYVSRSGYLSYKIKGHPCADKNGRVQASHLVYYQTTGHVPTEKETIHHKNGDTLDNRFENLELCTSYHPKGQRVEDKINWAIEFLIGKGYEVRKTESDKTEVDFTSTQSSV